MAKISPILSSALSSTSTFMASVLDEWKELSLDEFHELHIVQQEFEKIRKSLEARK